nr:ORF129/130 [Cydia pomonella granulovirus]AIU37055.1 ORF129/130 [Cydia pomonella granulovirus]QDW81189.1 ORF130 [Cydia pomonella granulovirus]QGY99301.1 ORF129/130 [Cydia pomonella granulovirus]QGY99585.1 ORF129/130 [Cydia pomonella granulovirus]
MMRVSVVLVVLVLEVRARFPPSNIGAIGVRVSSALVVSPQYYEIQLEEVSGKGVCHRPDINGNRLYLKENVSGITFQMFEVNGGYVYKHYAHNDILCLNSGKTFKMLTYPSTNNLPDDCLLQFDIISNDTLHTPVAYKLNERNDNLCVDRSDIGHDFKFRLYTTSKNTKYYLYITDTALSSVVNREVGTVFQTKYTRCMDYVDNWGTFICYINRKRWPCEDGTGFDKSVVRWKRSVIGDLINTFVSTSTESFFMYNNSSNNYNSSSSNYSSIIKSSSIKLNDTQPETESWWSGVNEFLFVNNACREKYNKYLFVLVFLLCAQIVNN